MVARHFKVLSPRFLHNIDTLYRLLYLILFCTGQALGQNCHKLQIQFAQASFVQDSTSVKLVAINTVPPNDTLYSDHSFTFKCLPKGAYVIHLSSKQYQSHEELLPINHDTSIVIDLIPNTHVLEEVVIKDKTNPFIGNSHTFESKDFSKYAASFGDPSRIVQNLPGVLTMNDFSNKIVVRGNSPSNTAFYLEDIEIPNSSALGGATGGGGGISIFNEYSIDKFDFYVGAYPSKFNNSNASIFNIQLKQGDAFRRKSVFKISPLGLFAGTEGYFKNGKKATYIVNARVWDLLWLQKVGVDRRNFRNTFIPSLKDYTCKISVPISPKSTLLFSAFGGMGSYNEDKGDYLSDKSSYTPMMNILMLQTKINSRLILKNRIAFGYAETKHINSSYQKMSSGWLLTIKDLKTREFKYYPSLTYYINSKLRYETGAIVTKTQSTVAQWFEYNGKIVPGILNYRGYFENYRLQHFQNFIYKANSKNEIDAGISVHKHSLSRKVYLEPRFNYSFKVSKMYTISTGIGKTAKLMFENTPYTKDQVLPTHSISFNNAHKFIFKKGLECKLEGYYQRLYSIYLSTDDYANFYSSYDITTHSPYLVTMPYSNGGIGSNYGFEYMLVKNFKNQSCLQLGGSFFKSEYKGIHTPWMRTPFDSRYNVALSGNKTWSKDKAKGKQNMIFSFRVVNFGGFYELPIDIDTTMKKQELYAGSNRFDVQVPNYFRLDLGFQLSYEKKKYTHEFRIDLINLTNRKNYMYQYFNKASQNIETVHQLSFLPAISYGLLLR